MESGDDSLYEDPCSSDETVSDDKAEDENIKSEGEDDFWNRKDEVDPIVKVIAQSFVRWMCMKLCR